MKKSENKIIKNLIEAIKANDLETVKDIIEKSDITKKDKSKAIKEVAETGNLEIAKYMISKNIDIDKEDILSAAAESGNLELFKLFCLHSTINMRNENILESAFKGNNIDIIAFMLNHNSFSQVDINNAFSNSIADISLKTLKQILKAHIVENSAKTQAAINVSRVPGKLNIIKTFYKDGIDIHHDNNIFYNSLSASNDYQVVKFCIEHGTNLHSNFSPIEWALLSKKPNMKSIRYLEKKGVNPLTDKKGLILSAGHSDIAFKYIKSLGIDFTDDWNAECMLYSAILFNNMHIAKAVIKENHNVDILNNLLAKAFQKNNLPIAQYLIKNGADIKKLKEIPMITLFANYSTLEFLVLNGAGITIDNSFCLTENEIKKLKELQSHRNH